MFGVWDEEEEEEKEEEERKEEEEEEEEEEQSKKDMEEERRIGRRERNGMKWEIEELLERDGNVKMRLEGRKRKMEREKMEETRELIKK